jgi:SAM-dependent methyltransferase
VSTASPFRQRLRRALPPLLLRRYDRLRLEAPVRIHDLRADLGERLRPSSPAPVPPAWLRAHVGRTSSRDEYVRVGRAGFETVVQAFEAHRDPARAYPRWLDFGCGCGRLCRYLPLPGVCEAYVGADVDSEAIRWNARNLRAGEFVLLAPRPPSPLPSRGFDVVYCVSVFTHLEEEPQFAWLDELVRVLSPGGLLIASTHSERLSATRPDLSPGELARLARKGFGFAPGSGRFNDATAFHSRQYLEKTWSRGLKLLGFESFGLFSF